MFENWNKWMSKRFKKVSDVCMHEYVLKINRYIYTILFRFSGFRNYFILYYYPFRLKRSAYL